MRTEQEIRKRLKELENETFRSDHSGNEKTSLGKQRARPIMGYRKDRKSTNVIEQKGPILK